MNKSVICRSASSVHDLARALASHITELTQTHPSVIWFVSGGSSIPVAQEALRLLGDTAVKNITVLLVDDYRDSNNPETNNWSRLVTDDFSKPVTKVFTDTVSAVEELGARYAEYVTQILQPGVGLIGQFGLGAGFHTGGMQPGSPAVSTDKLAIGYMDGDVARITITPACIQKLDTVFINSMGEDKRPLVEHFMVSEAATTIEPTQALKTGAQTYLYSDVLPS